MPTSVASRARNIRAGRPQSPFDRWQPPKMTAGFRRRPPGPLPLDRWEAVLRAEATVAYRLAAVASRIAWLARLLGVPATLALGTGGLGARERRVADLANSRLGRLLGVNRGQQPIRLDHTPDGRPKAGPLTGRHIATSLELLADMPFEELQECGWNVQPNSWCWPLNDVPFLRRHRKLWRPKHMPPAIDWDLDGQTELLRRVGEYAPELGDIRRGPDHRPGEYVWLNGAFGTADAYVYYGLLRELSPRRVVEVGAGASSLLLARALEKNGQDTQVTLVEPRPRWDVLGELPPGWVLHETVLQEAPPEMFRRLEAGDVLFYDGSHCSATASDVNWMLFRIMPALAPGVWIHFHDIFWPLDYPPEWILHEGLTWNEQYVLQAFLMHNRAYRVRLALAMLTTERREVMRDLFPEPRGVSVWLQKAN